MTDGHANTVTTKDGTKIYFKDWGTGHPVILSHGWPLSADAWDAQMLFLVHSGYRVIAYDRRGHGRSGQPRSGYDMDTFADDLDTLINALGLKDAALVGHSMGGGEIVRYMGRHGTARIAKAVLISAVPPLMRKTKNNPNGIPIAVFDKTRTGITTNRSQFFKDLSSSFYGYNKPNAKISQGIMDSFWLQGMQSSIIGVYDCVKAFSETDFAEDLKRIDVPTLIMHGDADQIVPIGNSVLSSKLIKNSNLKVIRDAPHGMCTTHANKVNAELLAFLKSGNANWASPKKGREL